MTDTKKTRISVKEHSPLEVELMTFSHMPGRREVSLIHPAGAFSSQVRLVNLDPQTALNLLAWLESEREVLEQLAKEQAE